MKKNSFTLPFKSNFFKEQDPFHLVIVFFLIFFGTAIFFSVPTFYDYAKFNQQIEKTINDEFKINIHNLKKISFKFIPSPHLLIKKGDLKINSKEIDKVSTLENIKVYISILDFYKDKKFNIKRIEVKKANFYFNFISLKNFIQNLKKNIVNNFIIKKSSFFYKNSKNEIILISTIKNFNYKIDFVNNKKILKINGNIFDSNYEFKYLIDYKNPNIQNVYLNLQNPNIIIENKLIFDYDSSNVKQLGNFNIEFLNQKNYLNYEIKKNSIKFLQANNNNSTFDLSGLVNFNPFHFDLIMNIKKINLEQLESFFYTIFKNQESEFENLSGNLKLNFEDIDYKNLHKGLVSLNFQNAKINSYNEKFNIGDFAVLEIVDYEFLENIDQILQMKIKVNILNSEKFNRFLFNYKKNKILSKKIFFTYQFNRNTKTHFISQVHKNGFGNIKEFYKFNNLQQLKNLLRDDNLFNLD